MEGTGKDIKQSYFLYGNDFSSLSRIDIYGLVNDYRQYFTKKRWMIFLPMFVAWCWILIHILLTDYGYMHVDSKISPAILFVYFTVLPVTSIIIVRPILARILIPIILWLLGVVKKLVVFVEQIIVFIGMILDSEWIAPLTKEDESDK